MARILALAGSNSSTSINHALVVYAAERITGHTVRVRKMADSDFPMYSEDREKASGIPEDILELYARIRESDALVISVNEHNGNPSAFTKNFLDWLSRHDRNFLEGLQVFLMSTSPGKRAAQSSHAVIAAMLPRFGADIAAVFSLPAFRENFKAGEGILNPDLVSEFDSALHDFLNAL